MESTSTPQQMSLNIPPPMWQRFRQAMLNARTENEEVIGFFFCKRHRLTDLKRRYLPQAWVVPTPECYERQSACGLALSQRFHWFLLKTYLLSSQLDVVHIHTHAGKAAPSFSALDDHYESAYAKFLTANWQTPRLISGVFDQTLTHSQFRLWDRQGLSSTPLKFSCAWIEPTGDQLYEHGFAYHLSPQETEIFDRQKVFGEVVQRQLGELTVGLVGCGGIGAVFAEELARLGVKKWVFVDPDRLETANLNRMPAATLAMVEQRWGKVDYCQWLVERIYGTGSTVRAIPTSIEAEKAKQEIADADLIVVATDNHWSRQIAQELALEYQRPLVCLGTHIEVRSSTETRLYCRLTIPPVGGGWCLMCGNMINLHRAALESAPPDITEVATHAGYIEGIDNPAVFWLNGICASTGVGVIHGIICGFLDVTSGLDWVYQFPSSCWLKTNPDYLNTADCYFCSPKVPIFGEEKIAVYKGDRSCF